MALALVLPSPTLSQQNNSDACPLHFGVLQVLIQDSNHPKVDPAIKCQYIRQGLRLLQSRYLQRTNSFLPPLNSSDSCWSAYQALIDNLRSSCGFRTDWISRGCMNITTRAQFEDIVSPQTLDNVSFHPSYLTGPSVDNVSDCTAYASIYAAAFANLYGPTDTGTAKCLFSLDYTSSRSKSNRRKVILVVLIACGVGSLLLTGGGWFLCRIRRRRKNEGLIMTMKNRGQVRKIEMGLGSELESIHDGTTLLTFTFEDIKKATKNFSTDSIIGRGGYGNVYKGTLSDGSEVALKRFKNCSAAGDATFAHEVEVIASVRHVNLVALRGYCTATTPFEGHQRIIVCDLMKNGSLHDHLFGPLEKKLSWPMRQKIALGTARGLAYLHYGAQPGIIHRDIKASNILLDERFEAKVADFGLAKFTPEGMTHMSTRYALYGQLTERSDVYSFGVVLLELLSGKKALVGSNEGRPSLVTDWAWSLVRKGRTLDVIESEMPEQGVLEVLEKYVLIAVLCSHPQLYARPTMDEVVKMLETGLSVPSIPERPIPLVAELEDIEGSASSSGSEHSKWHMYNIKM
ncbi:hypothetical protein I3760_07G095900 [Carya illinoinensis]|nr:hypothetical protein I3760_07G095900 [Carya illinoinensis]